MGRRTEEGDIADGPGRLGVVVLHEAYGLCYYDADHAFVNDKLPSYDAEETARAWERTGDFLDALARDRARG
jgi:dienelactone hydrolase